MSYIRCTSNPEGLYIWSDGKVVFITHCIKSPFASPLDFVEQIISVRKDIFDNLCKQWLREGSASHGKTSIREFYIFTGKKNRGEKVPKDYNCFTDRRKTDYKVRFKHGKHFFYMWKVTWESVCEAADEG